MQPIIPSTTTSTNNKEHSAKSSSNESEKLMIQHNPEIDDIIVDSYSSNILFRW